MIVMSSSGSVTSMVWTNRWPSLVPCRLAGALRIAKDSCGYAEYRYKNTLTGEIRSQDPRLPELTRPWHTVDLERRPGDPSIWECYENEVTGEILNTDPRLLPDALRQQGIPLQAFRLI